MSRVVIIDTEATGLLIEDGHRFVEVAAIEMVDGKLTGQVFHTLINPDRDIPDEVVKIHGITNEMVADKPFFAAIAKELRDFIGDAPIVITCRTGKDGYVLDRDMMAMEMKGAGLPPFPDTQWLNVRLWSEAMFGNDEARLDRILDRYNIDRSERDKKGHSAILDAQLLAEVYLRLKADYQAFLSQQSSAKPTPPAA